MDFHGLVEELSGWKVVGVNVSNIVALLFTSSFVELLMGLVFSSVSSEEEDAYGLGVGVEKLLVRIFNFKPWKKPIECLWFLREGADLGLPVPNLKIITTC